MAPAASITGKVVVITGGARGIGLATATALHNLGASVAIGDVDEAKVKQSGNALGLDVYGKLDVTDADSFAGFLDQVERQLGPIDVLINNAGIMPLGQVVDEPDAVTRRILDINVYGVIVGTKLAGKRMIPRGRGQIINVASLAGETYIAGAATYCASKYAVVGFTDAARIEYRRTGVKVSLVLPTFVNTELTAGTTELRGLRNAEPGEIADAIVQLIAKPRPRVRITKAAGALVASRKFMPRAVAESINRRLGGERVLAQAVNVEKRRAYEARARGEE